MSAFDLRSFGDMLTLVIVTALLPGVAAASLIFGWRLGQEAARAAGKEWFGGAG